MKNKDVTNIKIDSLHEKVKYLLEEGLSNEEIVKRLDYENLEPYYIETIIENILNEKDNKKSFRNSMIMGGFFIIAGLLINLFSYRVSENENSSSFLLFWGIIVTGVVTIIRGFILYRR